MADSSRQNFYTALAIDFAVFVLLIIYLYFQLFSRGYAVNLLSGIGIFVLPRFIKVKMPALDARQKRLRFMIGNWRYGLVAAFVIYWAIRHSNVAVWCLTSLGLLVVATMHYAAWLELQEDLKRTSTVASAGPNQPLAPSA
jgi:hypothetical protein